MIRPAAPGDAAALIAIARAAYAPFVPLIGREPPPMQQDFPADIADGAAWVSGSPIQGYIVARPKGADWLIENVGITPPAQGRGLGRALIAFAEEEGQHRGHARVVLYTNAAMTRNLSLYPRLGYVEAGRGRTASGLDRVHFAKALAPHSARSCPT